MWAQRIKVRSIGGTCKWVAWLSMVIMAKVVSPHWCAFRVQVYYQEGQGRERGKAKSEGKVACTFILFYVYFLTLMQGPLLCLIFDKWLHGCVLNDVGHPCVALVWNLERFCENSKSGGNLESVSKWHLGLTNLSNGQSFGQSGQHEKCSSWWGLGWGAKSWQGLVWKFLNKRAQSG